MVTFFVTSVFVLGLVAIAIYSWQKLANQSQTIEPLFPPPPPRSLFPPAPPDSTTNAPTQPPVLNKTAVDKALVQQSIEHWQKSPDRNSTAKMLHAAALSDDAEAYQTAVEAVLRSWRETRLRDISGVELQSLINGEFWVLSSGTRSSGAGFVLKRTLSIANRELQTKH